MQHYVRCRPTVKKDYSFLKYPKTKKYPMLAQNKNVRLFVDLVMLGHVF